MKIGELSEKTGINVRLLRKYMAIGLLARPIGKTTNAYYGEEHVSEALTIRQLLRKGCSLEEAGVQTRARRVIGKLATEPPAKTARSPALVRTFRVTDGVLVTFDDPDNEMPDAKYLELVNEIKQLCEDARRSA